MLTISVVEREVGNLFFGRSGCKWLEISLLNSFVWWIWEKYKIGRLFMMFFVKAFLFELGLDCDLVYLPCVCVRAYTLMKLFLLCSACLMVSCFRTPECRGRMGSSSGNWSLNIGDL